MRDLRLLDAYRNMSPEIMRHYGGVGDSTCGFFTLPSQIDGQPMVIIASSDVGWEHVSVSRKNRCPNWPEMEFVKNLFFKDNETVMQLHVPAVEHINIHPYCLHLWRPTELEIPRPPSWMVGTVSQAEVTRLRALFEEKVNG